MSASFQNNLITTLPSISKIEFESIHKNYFKVISINFLLLFVPFLVALILLHQLVFEDEILAYVTYIYLAFFVVFGYIFLHLVLSFPKKKYAIREKDISYKSGLFIKLLTTVPFSRIQHVEIDEKPISRIFGLSSLSVYTAGDSSDDLEIKGLKRETALQIKEFISRKINE